MALNAGETKHLMTLALADKSKGYDFVESKPKSDDLSENVFKLIADWYHFAILNLIDCQGFRWDCRWISRRLGISQAQAKIAMDRLTELKLVELKAGTLVARSEHLNTLGELPSAARRAFHHQTLGKAQESLENQKVEDRDISGVGMALDPRHLPAIKKEIAEFQDRILAAYGKGKKTEVYFLEMALFRLTQEGEK